MSVPRYPKYKDSGVEWIREVPAHWAVNRFKHYVERNDGGAWGQDPDGASDTIVLRSTEQTVDGHWKLDDPASRKLTQAEVEATLLAEGDLLVTKSSGSSLHIGKTTLVSADVAAMRCGFSNFMQRLRTTSTVDPRLAWYVLNNDLARLQFDLLSNSTTGLANLNATMIGQILLPVAPLPEQASIVAFLDRETAKIDHLVAEQERLIELLKEKRQAVISHAVTKGLNPDVPIKDSGIEWLGDIPAHWDVMRLKRDLAFLTSGSRGWAEHYADDGALFLRIANLTRDTVGLDLSDVQRVAVPDGAEGARTRVQPGDVLFSITAFLGSIAVIPEGLEPAYVSQHVALGRLRQRRLSPKWVGYVALSLIGKTWFETQSYGGTKIQLSLEDVRDLPLPVPPISEQKALTSHIESRLADFSALTAEALRAIDLLQERRTALISAAVTGQIDVREAAGRAA